MDNTAMFKIGYGLYAVTCNDGVKDNALIVNTVTQLASDPNTIGVAINKANYSHDVIKNSGILNVNCLDITAPFSVFQSYGFRSGRDVNKFEGQQVTRSENGLVYLMDHVNAYLSLKVENYVDLGSHGLFLCSLTDAKTLDGSKETMTYSYYHANV
ncbi:MAG: flavin reductase, partial [Clostridia bacterium]|nr:flavin reductase [Clostridia bacterium]